MTNLNIANAAENQEYIIKEIAIQDEKAVRFLYSLGVYVGNIITLRSKLGNNYIIEVKNARYGIDTKLAEGIIIKVLYKGLPPCR